MQEDATTADRQPDHLGLLEGLATTRAIRRYTDEPVSEEDLAAVMWAATRAPSGSNRQPFRFLVLRDGPGAQEAKGILGRSFRAAWASKVQADGYREGSGGAGDSPKARMAATMQRFVDRFEQTPVVVLATVGRHRAAHLSEGGSVFPACQNLLLAARARGLGGVMTMWHEAVADELHAALAIPDDIVIAATIALGHPEGAHGPVRRRPVGELVYEDRWQGRAAWAVDPPGTRFTSAGPPRGPDRSR